MPCQIHRRINFPLHNEQRPVGDRITDDGFATVNAPTSSPWSEPTQCSTQAHSSKDPTNQEVINESRDGAKRTVARSLRPFISAWLLSERDADLQLSRWC